MARIYLSPLIVDIRNKQSDTVFSKWKGINYIRSRVIPANPKTAPQIAIREALAQLVSLWQDMYSEVKLNWDEWASGRDYSGFNKFIGKNAVDERDGNLLNITQEVGFTQLTAFAPVTGGASGELSIVWTPTPVPANTDLVVLVREAGDDTWVSKTIHATTVASPQTQGGYAPTTLFEVYGYFVKDTAPTGEEVGKDESDTATSQT